MAQVEQPAADFHCYICGSRPSLAPIYYFFFRFLVCTCLSWIIFFDNTKKKKDIIRCIPSNTCPAWFTTPSSPDSPMEQPPRGCPEITLLFWGLTHIGFLTNIPSRPAVIFPIVLFTSKKLLSQPSLFQEISKTPFFTEMTPFASSWLIPRKVSDLSSDWPVINLKDNYSWYHHGVSKWKCIGNKLICYGYCFEGNKPFPWWNSTFCQWHFVVLFLNNPVFFLSFYIQITTLKLVQTFRPKLWSTCIDITNRRQSN